MLATDIDEVALAVAARAAIAPGSTATLPVDIAERWLEREVDGYRVKAAAREIVTVARYDSLSSPGAAPRQGVIAEFDIVSCRNLLIYLEPEAQEIVLRRLLKACAPQALFMLGHCETAPASLRECFLEVRPGLPIFRVAGRGQ